VILPSIESLPFPPYYEVCLRGPDHFGHAHYTHKRKPYAYGSDVAVKEPVLNRTATSLIGGRILAQKLAQKTPLTLEILTGELGGGIPISDDHPLKEAAVRGAELIINQGWEIARTVVSGTVTRKMDQKLCAPNMLPVFIPYRIDGVNAAEFCGMDLIYTIAGGQFNTPAGMAFHYRRPVHSLYHSVSGDSSDPFSVEVYFSDIPDEDREVQIEGLKRLVALRNTLFETLMEERLNDEVDAMVARLKSEDLLSDEIIEAAKTYEEARAEAANGASYD